MKGLFGLSYEGGTVYRHLWWQHLRRQQCVGKDDEKSSEAFPLIPSILINS